MRHLARLLLTHTQTLLAAGLLAAPAYAAITQSVDRQYDVYDRLIKETYSDGSEYTFSYDDADNVIEKRGPNWTYSYTYDARNQLTSTSNLGTNETTRFKHDADGNLVSVTDPRGLVTRYEHNGFGELLKQTSPDSGATLYIRRDDGLTATQIDAKNQQTQYEYDVALRIKKISYADGLAQTYTYGSNGISANKLTEIALPTNAIRYNYDNEGRLASETRSVWNKDYTTSYGYDTAGRLNKLTYPSGRIVTFFFNAAGQVNKVTTQQSKAAEQVVIQNLTYRPFGQVSGWTWGNGEVRTNGYDNLNQITSYNLGDSTVTLTREPGSLISQLRVSGGWWERILQRLGLPIGQAHHYQYDRSERITSWLSGGHGFRDNVFFNYGQGYKYDANGNRTELTIDGLSYKQYIDAKSNRLTAASYPDMRNPVFEYDANGSRIQEGGNHYSYDARGRLIEVAGAQFTVNALGERVAKTYQGATTLFHYDQWGRLIAETDPTGVVKREYLYLGELPVALVDNGMDLRNIHTDHLGAPRLVTDATQHAIWAWPLGEPFGNTPANEDPESTGGKYTFNLRFPGQYFDKETGHHYNYFRDYDPQNGRYVQSDPIGLAGGINTYIYVNGNPLSYVDPLGLQAGFPSFPVTDLNIPYNYTPKNTPRQSRIPNMTGQYGVAGQVGGTLLGASCEVGVSVPSTADDVCTYTQACYTVGPQWVATVGGAVSVGQGLPSTGVTYSQGGGWFGGSGVVGNAQVTFNEDRQAQGTRGVSRGFAGIGAGAGATYVKCVQATVCIRR